jgi:hypothetical protein
MKTKAYMYHDENGTISDMPTEGRKMYLLCVEIKNSLNTDVIDRSK